MNKVVIFIFLILIGCQKDDDMIQYILSSSIGVDEVVNPPPVYDYIAVPLYGQSLSLNASSTPFIDPPVAYAKEFSNGLTGTPNTSSTLVSLTKTNDVVTNMMQMMINSRDVSDTTELVSWTSGVGGISIANLDQGTNPYIKFMANVTQLKRIADDESKTCNIPAVVWVHGNEDLKSTDNTYYYASVQSFYANLNTDIKAITGQTNDIYLVLNQMATHADYGRYPRIAIQQYELARDFDYIKYFKSNYNGDFIADEVHGTTQLYGLMGAKAGYQIYNEILEGNTVSKFRITNHVYSALKSTITFEAPVLPLVLDNSGDVSAIENFGFKLFTVNEDLANIANNTISIPTPTITNVTLVGNNTIEVDYDSDPTGLRLTYGVFGNGYEQVTGTRNLGDVGRVNGARGNLRDSQGNTVTMSITDSGSVEQFNALHNWCPTFEIQL